MKACKESTKSQVSKESTKSKEGKESKNYILVRFSDIPLHKPISKVKATKDSFVIDTGHYKYDIDFTRCDSVSKVLKWVQHLSEKTWMTKRMLNTFTQLALKRIGYEINWNM